MKERFRTPTAVMLLLTRETDAGRELLLLRRKNTGYMDGFLDCSCAGHVEHGEPMRAAIVREAAEELGLTLDPEAVTFALLMHDYAAKTDTTYTDVYFTCADFSGTPVLAEPEKCAELVWGRLDALPHDMIPKRRAAVDAILAGVRYLEHGWHTEKEG